MAIRDILLGLEIGGALVSLIFGAFLASFMFLLAMLINLYGRKLERNTSN